MRYAPIAAIFLMSLATVQAQPSSSSGRELPPFLAPYYVDAFNAVDKGLMLQEKQNKDNISHYVYSSPDQVASLTFENIICERDRCQVLYQNAVQYFNKLATDNSGEFTQATPTEFAAKWQTGLANSYSFIAKLPNSVLISSYSERLDRHVDANSFLTELKTAVDHQRYDQVERAGQVQVGLWSGAIHNYASWLLGKGKKDDAVGVLKILVAAAPFEYQAHAELTDNAHDSAVARGSAAIVYDNAEDSELVSKAGRYLGQTNLEFAALPVLENDNGGLHVVLIALPECDLKVVGEAARLYENAMGIPVSIRRLAEPWEYGVPTRIPDQRRIQQVIIQKRGPNINFGGWDLARYRSELLKTVETSDALAKFSMEGFVAKLDSRPGQYDAGPLIESLASILAKYRPHDARAMYVGVTGTDIFSGDTNYLFSSGAIIGGAATTILSYSRFSAKMTGERYESRKRLAERIAKQLVPPTLSALGIPRPADPTDAYSYADSVERVDQKTLTLSTPTKEALDKFR